MKVQTWLACIALTLIPSFSFAQYQVSATQPQTRGGYVQANYGPPAQAGYAPTSQASYAPQPTFSPQPTFAQPIGPAPGGTMQSFGDVGMSGGCDSCDAGGGGFAGGGFSGGGFAGGGFDGGVIDGGGCGGGGFGGCGGFGGGSGTYFTIFGGGLELDDQNSFGIQRNVDVDYGQGWAVGGAIGKRVARNLRAEIEYAFRSQTPDTLAFNGVNQGILSGFQNSHAAMFNFAYDLVLGRGNIVPYIGGGVGVASVDSRIAYGPGIATLDGDDSSVAYQWMAGISFRARPNMEMFLEYRFFEIDDPKINRFGGPPINGQTPNVLLESEYVSNDIFAGLRFNF